MAATVANFQHLATFYVTNVKNPARHKNPYAIDVELNSLAKLHAMDIWRTTNANQDLIAEVFLRIYYTIFPIIRCWLISSVLKHSAVVGSFFFMGYHYGHLGGNVNLKRKGIHYTFMGVALDTRRAIIVSVSTDIIQIIRRS